MDDMLQMNLVASSGVTKVDFPWQNCHPTCLVQEASDSYQYMDGTVSVHSVETVLADATPQHPQVRPVPQRNATALTHAGELRGCDPWSTICS